MAPDQQREIADGPLVVSSRREGNIQIVSFRGELDLANAGTAESALMAAVPAEGERVVVDLRALEFIDSTGIALLVAAVARHPDGVCFVPSDSAAVNRVLALTGVATRLPLGELPVA